MTRTLTQHITVPYQCPCCQAEPGADLTVKVHSDNTFEVAEATFAGTDIPVIITPRLEDAAFPFVSYAEAEASENEYRAEQRADARREEA